ncbi:MAG: carboxymuconolactone decarboxylase family protein [Gemmatimonadetes bacterium]|nr:carboxymuconolactone decarboxylase family protein [Gemmatimonadota bacterium]
MTDDELRNPQAPAWIETIPPADAKGVLADVYARIAGTSGYVANILRSLSLHPEALRDHYSLYRTLMFSGGALSGVERESIAVTVSSANGCAY